MKTLRRLRLTLLVGVLAASSETVLAQDLLPIRIGWQPTTTVEAQVAHVLAKTDLLERHGLAGEMVMFSFGPAVNEALVGDSIDVGFIGDMPSVTLAAAGAPTAVIARLSTFRGSIVATPASGVEDLAALEGTPVYGPVGSSIYLAAVSMLEEAGLEPNGNVPVVNMGFTDLADSIRSSKIEAAFIWDPWIALFEGEDLATPVASDTSLIMVTAMRRDFLDEHPEAVESFLKAQKEALLFAALNQDLVNGWFQEPEAARALPTAVIQEATAYDPQWSATSLGDIRVAFSPEERERYLGLGERAATLGVFPSKPPLEEHMDFSIAETVDASDWEFDPSAVTVKE